MLLNKNAFINNEIKMFLHKKKNTKSNTTAVNSNKCNKVDILSDDPLL